MLEPDKKIKTPHQTQGRRNFRVEAIVIHIMEGTLAGTDAWFADPISKVSAHFGIGKKGELHQYVEVKNTAWHAGRVNNPTWRGIKVNQSGGFFNPNYYTIGIEHEGFGQTDWSVAMYQKSAELIAHLCVDFLIPLERTHIIGHHEIYSVKSCPGHKVDFNHLIHLARQFRDALTNPDAPVPVVDVPATPALSTVVQAGTVTVARTLNIRQKAPSTAAAVVAQALADTQLTFAGWVTNGQPVNGNRKWYFDVNGNYFWSGATS